MASSINASTSGGGGVITTADTSGVLNLQTAGTTAISISASQIITVNGLSLGSGPAGSSACTAFGLNALQASGSVGQSIAIGWLAAQNSGNTGDGLTAIGSAALYSNTTGSNNTAIGGFSLFSNTTGSNNCAVGPNVAGSALGPLGNNTTGSNNTAIGALALGNNTTASNNTAVGWQAAFANTTGTSLTAIGYLALTNNTTGVGNNAIGLNSCVSTTTGSQNNGYGQQALNNNVSGNNNTAFGYQAGYGVTGSNNICFGYGTGSSAITLAGGSGNTLIGFGASTSGTTDNYELVLCAQQVQTLTGKGTNTGYIYTYNGSAYGSIYQGNNSASWATTSDARIKENVIDVANGLDTIKSLRPVKFNYILTGKSDIGFIAQEYQRVLPEQITTHQPSGKEKDLTNGDDVLAINQNLVPYLVKAIQEQQILINNLTERLTKLEVK